MNYSNTDTRLKKLPALNPAILRRITRLRNASRQARTAAEKKALSTLLSLA